MKDLNVWKTKKAKQGSGWLYFANLDIALAMEYSICSIETFQEHFRLR